MTGQEKVDFNNAHPIVEQSRPIWKHEQHFKDLANPSDVTVLICHKNTKSFVQMTIESLLRFYPDIKILVVDDDSNDDSVAYLRYKELTTPNITVWWKKDYYSGHGGHMDRAIKTLITTEYVMLLDSDMVIERGGFIEPMLQRFSENSKLYAIGTLQYTSYSNNGGEPFTAEDAIPYANPQLSIYHRPTYLELEADFLNDGTPCILNMKAAHDSKLDVEYFPTDLYASHNSGSSWVKPRTIWMDDHNVFLRPFVTFIVSRETRINLMQDDNDFDIVVVGDANSIEYTFTDKPDPHPFTPKGNTFSIRFNVHGEYVIDMSNESIVELPTDFISTFKKKVNEENAGDVVVHCGLEGTKRTIWQQTKSIL